eukprot:Awhi_evm2s14288
MLFIRMMQALLAQLLLQGSFHHQYSGYLYVLFAMCAMLLIILLEEWSIAQKAKFTSTLTAATATTTTASDRQVLNAQDLNYLELKFNAVSLTSPTPTSTSRPTPATTTSTPASATSTDSENLTAINLDSLKRELDCVSASVNLFPNNQQAGHGIDFDSSSDDFYNIDDELCSDIIPSMDLLSALDDFIMEGLNEKGDVDHCGSTDDDVVNELSKCMGLPPIKTTKEMFLDSLKYRQPHALFV